MSETDPCIVGIHACGCITFANSRPDDLHRDDEREIVRFIREGGQVVRTTVGEARARPHFLVSKCPHDPPGWTGPEPCIPCDGTGELDGGYCPDCKSTGWADAA